MKKILTFTCKVLRYSVGRPKPVKAEFMVMYYGGATEKFVVEGTEEIEKKRKELTRGLE
jgi:hypothetical protein